MTRHAAPPGFALVRLLSPVVPGARRAEWVAEWEGELAYGWRRAEREGSATWLTRATLHWRALGAIADAVWLRRHHGASPMLALDLRYAARSLWRRPGFATVVVLTLALGIGATTAIFSVVNGVLLRPLPFPQPERLIALQGHPTNGDTEKVGTSTSYPDFEDIRAQATVFDGLAAVRTWPTTLTGGGEQPARVRVTLATSDLWPIMGSPRPVLGRGLQPADERPDAPAVAVLSHALWRARYGGDPGIVGHTIALDGRPVTVVGVMPAGLRLTGDTQLWRPLVPDETDRARGAHRLGVIGRLRPGVSLHQAGAEVRAITRRLELQYPEDNAQRSARLTPLRDSIVGDTRPALLVLLGAVALVLLIGCANLASLFLARAASREREMAVRAALGAGRGRLVRHWMAESFLLTAAGAAAGLAVAWLGMKGLMAWAPRTIPRADEVALDLPVLLFMLATSVAVGLAFGVLPMVQQRRGTPSLASLRDGARGVTGGMARRRLRNTLVVAEVALATVLVTGAALLLKSFAQLQQAELGFAPDGLVVANVQLPQARYDSVARVLHFYERVRAEVAAIPGVRQVAVAYEHPLSEGWTSSYVLEGRDAPPPGHEPEARVRPVWPGYFSTVGVPLVSGRDVSEQDRFDSPGVVVVNEAFARRHFAGQSALGHRLRRGSWWPGGPETFEIVGVVADEPMLGPGAGSEPATYFPHAQFPMNDMWLVVRTEGDAATLAPELRARIWRLDADLPLDDVRTMRELLGASVAGPRFNATLLAAFAAAALLLAAVGVYGVLSYAVAQRTGEIGVRMALGARRWQLLRVVVGEGVALALLGVLLGVVASLGTGRLLSSLLHGVSAGDPVILASAAATLTLVALAAAALPAWRASRVDPVVPLRYD